MLKSLIPAAGGALPAAEEMAEAARQIDRDAASIAASLAVIHGGQYRIDISHDAEYVMVRRSLDPHPLTAAACSLAQLPPFRPWEPREELLPCLPPRLRTNGPFALRMNYRRQ
jgi:hypothetical protein